MHYRALMDETAMTLSAAIGARVKQQRRTRDWTLDHLAEAASLSRRMLVNVEQGDANPSMATLLKISEALGIGLPQLVQPPRNESTTITRAGAGAALWSGEHGGRGVLVASSTAPHVHELWDWHLEPAELHRSEPHPAGTRELLHVRSGSLTITVDGDAFALADGDALSFPGDVQHSYLNPGTTTAVFSLTVLEPATSTRT
jgi:transcriptional regulator with XRE-family HTH domain